MSCQIILADDFSGLDVHLDLIDNRGLIALQGPQSSRVLSKLVPNPDQVTKMPFMTSLVTEVAGAQDCRVTRCG